MGKKASLQNVFTYMLLMHVLYETKLTALTHIDDNSVTQRWLDMVVLVGVMTAVVALMWDVYINKVESHTRYMCLRGYRWFVSEELEFSISIASWFRCCATELDIFSRNNSCMSWG